MVAGLFRRRQDRRGGAALRPLFQARLEPRPVAGAELHQSPGHLLALAGACRRRLPRGVRGQPGLGSRPALQRAAGSGADRTYPACALSLARHRRLHRAGRGSEKLCPRGRPPRVAGAFRTDRRGGEGGRDRRPARRVPRLPPAARDLAAGRHHHPHAQPARSPAPLCLVHPRAHQLSRLRSDHRRQPVDRAGRARLPGQLRRASVRAGAQARQAVQLFGDQQPVGRRLPQRADLPAQQRHRGDHARLVAGAGQPCAAPACGRRGRDALLPQRHDPARRRGDWRARSGSPSVLRHAAGPRRTDGTCAVDPGDERGHCRLHGGAARNLRTGRRPRSAVAGGLQRHRFLPAPAPARLHQHLDAVRGALSPRVGHPRLRHHAGEAPALRAGGGVHASPLGRRAGA